SNAKLTVRSSSRPRAKPAEKGLDAFPHGTPASITARVRAARPMDLRHLRAFAAVADSRSFSKAARQLRIAQPPLSRHIRQLEIEIGVRLFVRTTSGVSLTREGTLLLE